MEAIELMYYTITAFLIVFTIALVFLIYQLTLFFALIKTLIWQLQKFPLLAAGTIQAGFMSFILKLIRPNKDKGGV